MKLFETIQSGNWIPALRRAQNDGICSVSPNLEIRIKLGGELASPWIVIPEPNRECLVPLNFLEPYFNIIAQQCFNCWKCVYRPPTLKKLFEVLEFQQKRGVPAKCGCEKREVSGRKGDYGAFWYVPLGSGLKGAREYLKDLNKQLSGIGASARLKRGCTEFENKFGPSDKWDKYKAVFNELELAIREKLTIEHQIPLDSKANKQIELDTMQRWIIHAAEYGDPTYLNYVDKPFWTPVVWYDGSSHREEDYDSDYRPTETKVQTVDSARIALI